VPENRLSSLLLKVSIWRDGRHILRGHSLNTLAPE
jgi:hypothetical protein